MKPLISVIVPVYKTEQYLPKCVDSILNQTYKNLEIILVEDGSPDNCPAICDSYAQKDSRVKVIHQKNRGLAGAVKRGIEHASGDYIGFTDSDDFIAENMFEKLAEAACGGADLVQCGFMEVFEDGSVSGGTASYEKTLFEGESLKELSRGMLNSFEQSGAALYANRWTKLVRAELLKNNLVYYREDIKIGEDINCIFPVVLDCKTIVLLPDALYFYLQRSSAMSKGYKSTLERDYRNMKEVLTRITEEKGRYAEFEEALAKRDYTCGLNLIRNICRSPLPRRQKKAEIRKIHKSLKKAKVRHASFKKRLQRRGLEMLLALRFYGLITLFVR